MAKYTVELRDVVKSGFNIFDFPYDFYDETKKPDFEKKFIQHFYFHEIGTETVGRFQHNLMVKLDEVLPYYNMLFETAKIEYDLLNNYNVTEKFNKTKDNIKDVTGNASQSGTTEERSNLIDTKYSDLNSETDHTETLDYNRNETQNDTGQIDKTTNVVIDDRKVGSDTPNALLSMENIKTNVYASKADIQDGKTDTTDKQVTAAAKTGETKEETTRTTKDTVDARSDEENEQRRTSDIDATSNTNTTQNEKGNEVENYELTRVGNIGVMTASDLLEKHIEFQRKLTTIYIQFFEQCNDLFMQIY